jgi:hypothetical protein
MITMEDAYPKEDVCRYCGAHVGWMLHPVAEMLALGVCDKKECQEKSKQERRNKDVGR